MSDDTPQLSPQQIAIRNAVSDLLDGQLTQYSMERLMATVPVVAAFLAANAAEQRALGVHVSRLLLRAMRHELVARRDAQLPPAHPPAVPPQLH